MKILINNLEELRKFAQHLAPQLKRGDILLFQGEIGTGKTTLIAEIGKALGIKDFMSSPSFTLINKYQGATTLYHIDLYRLNNLNDLLLLDLPLYFQKKQALVFIEWAEKMETLLPDKYLKIALEYAPNEARKISLCGTKQDFSNLIKSCYTFFKGSS